MTAASLFAWYREIVGFAASYALRRFGVQSLSFEESSFGLTGAELQGVALSYHDLVGRTVEGTAARLALDYQLSGWTLRLGGIHLDGGRIRYDRPRATPTVLPTGSPVEALLATLRTLPSVRVALRNTALTGAVNAQIEELTGTVGELFDMKGHGSLYGAQGTITAHLDSVQRRFAFDGSVRSGRFATGAWDLAGGFPDPFRATIDAGSSIRPPRTPSAPPFMVETVVLESPLTVTATKNGFEVSGGTAKVTGGQLRAGTVNATLPTVSVALRSARIQEARWRAEGTTSIPSTTVRIGTFDTPLLDWHLQITATQLHTALRVDGGNAKYPELLHLPLTIHPKGVIELDKTTVRLFGGRIEAGPVTISPTDPVWELPLRFRGLELADLLAAYPQQRLEGSGKIGGEFVLRRSTRGFTVIDGKVTSEAPGGVLRYRLPPGTSPPAGLEVALAALSDFRYRQIGASFDFDPNGTLILRTRIEGNNPGWQGGRTVEFNVQFQEDLFALLTTLRLVGALGKQQKVPGVRTPGVHE
jgi:hypothetical protein